MGSLASAGRPVRTERTAGTARTVPEAKTEQPGLLERRERAGREDSADSRAHEGRLVRRAATARMARTVRMAGTAGKERGECRVGLAPTERMVAREERAREAQKELQVLQDALELQANAARPGQMARTVRMAREGGLVPTERMALEVPGEEGAARARREPRAAPERTELEDTVVLQVGRELKVPRVLRVEEGRKGAGAAMVRTVRAARRVLMERMALEVQEALGAVAERQVGTAKTERTAAPARRAAKATLVLAVLMARMGTVA